MGDEKLGCVSGPVGAVQRAVLDRLAEMPWLYASPAVQVRDRPRYLQDAVMGPRGKPQPRDGVFQQLFAFGGNRAMLANHLRHHLRVGVSLFLAPKSFELSIACGDHPLPAPTRLLPPTRRSHFLLF